MNEYCNYGVPYRYYCQDVVQDIVPVDSYIIFDPQRNLRKSFQVFVGKNMEAIKAYPAPQTFAIGTPVTSHIRKHAKYCEDPLLTLAVLGRTIAGVYYPGRAVHLDTMPSTLAFPQQMLQEGNLITTT